MATVADDEHDGPASTPYPLRRRLDRGWAELVAASVGCAYGGEPAWGGAASLGGELRVLSDWIAPRRLEDRVESEAVAGLERACLAVFGVAATRLGPPSQVRLAGDVAAWKAALGGAAGRLADAVSEVAKTQNASDPRTAHVAALLEV